MANNKKPQVAQVLPENRSMIMPTITNRGLEAILAGNNPANPAFSRNDDGTVKVNYGSLLNYKPGNITYSDLGMTTEEAIKSKEYLERMANDIVDGYSILSPIVNTPHNRNAIAERIWNEAWAIPDYAAQSAVRTAAGAYNSILAQARNAQEETWKEKIGTASQEDVLELEGALQRYENKDVDLLHLSVNSLKNEDGSPLSYGAKELFKEYKRLLHQRREDALRIKTMQLFEETEVTAFREFSDKINPTPLKSHLGKDYKGDENTIIHTLGKLTGDVAGSAAISYGVGSLYRGAAGALKVLKSIKDVKKAYAAGAALQKASMLFANAGAVGAEAALAVPIGMSQYEAVRRQAILSGQDISTANAAGLIAGIAEAGLEFAGFKVFKRLYTRDSLIMQKILGEIVPESLQEGSQQFAENIITNAFGITSYKFSDIMSQVGIAMIGGAMGGMALGNTFTSTNIFLSRISGVASKYDEKLAEFSSETKKQAVKEIADEYSSKNTNTSKSSAQEVAEGEKKTTSKQTEQQEVPLDMNEIKETYKNNKDRMFSEDKDGSFIANEDIQETVDLGEGSIDESVSEMQETKTEQNLSENTETSNKQEKPEGEVVPEQKEQTAEEKLLSTDVNKCKDIIKLMYGDLFKLYAERAKKSNPDVTPEQLKNGFNAVAASIKLAKEGTIGTLVDNLTANMITFLSNQTNLFQQNKIELANWLNENGVDKETRDKLLSKDWTVRLNAQWDVAKTYMRDLFAKKGLDEAYADEAYTFLKGVAYEFTFLHPSVTVADMLNSLDLNIVVTQLEDIRGVIEIPENLKNILSKVKHNKNLKSIGTVNNLVALLKGGYVESTDGISPSRYSTREDNASDINSILYGEMLDPDVKKTYSSIRFLQGVINNTIAHSELAQRDYTQEDYFKIAVMKTCGFSYNEIGKEFGIKGLTNKSFMENFNEVYPMTDDSEAAISKTEELLKQASHAKKADTAEGLFDPSSNMVVVKENANKTAVHETGHFTLTNFVTRSNNLIKTGLVKENSYAMTPLTNLKKELTRQLKSKGKPVTEEILQEKVLESLDNFFVKGGLTQSEEVNKLIKELSTVYNEDTAEGVANAVYSNSEFETQEEKEAKKTTTDKFVQRILENNSPVVMLQKISEIEDKISFNEPLVAEVKSRAGAESQLNTIYNMITDVLNDTFVPDREANMALLDTAYKNNDLIGMLYSANVILTKAKSFCYSCLYEKTKSSKNTKGLNANTRYFYKDSNKDFLLTKRDTTTVAEDVKNWSKKIKNMTGAERFAYGKDIVKHGLFNEIKHFTESLSHAAYAVNNELGAAIEKAAYDMGMQTTADKIMVTEFDKLTKPAFKKDQKLYTNFVTILANPLLLEKRGRSMRMEAVRLVTQKVSPEAGKALDYIFQRINEVRSDLIAYGLNENMFFKGDYFPLKVEDYNGLLSHLGLTKKAYAIKQADRMYKEAIDIAAKQGKTLTDDQKKQIYSQIIDKTNSLIYNKISDEDKVTSYMNRQLEFRSPEELQYYADPCDALASFFESASRTIFMRKLFGKQAKSENTVETDYKTGEQVTTPSIDIQRGIAGRIIYNYGTIMKDDPAAQEAIDNFIYIASMFMSRVKTSPKNVFGVLRQINNISTLGSPVNTLNQAMDLVPVLQMYGWKTTIDAIEEVAKGKGIKLADIGIESSNELFRPVSEGVLKKIQKGVFKFTGFEKFDTFVKEVAINSAKTYFQKALNSDPNSSLYKEAIKYVDEMFPVTNFASIDENVSGMLNKEKMDTRESVIQNLKEGIETDNTKALYWHQLAKIQPISSVVAAAKLGAVGDFGKMCYQFTGPALRQLEWLGDRIKEKYAKGGVVEAGKDLAKLLLFLLSIGLPKEMLTNIIRNRKTNIPMTALLMPGHFIMINEYTLAIAKRDGAWAAVSSIAGSNVSLINNLTKDVVRLVEGKEFRGYTTRSIPLGIGDFLYYYCFGGYQFNKKMGTNLITNPLVEATNDINSAAKNIGGI